MDGLGFYTVDRDYLEFLRKAEINKRGFTKIPNYEYNKNDKFVCGVVFNIDKFNYYAPISSYKIKQKENMLIKDKKGDVKSSIRFNYMFPVPRHCLKYKDISKEDDVGYRTLLNIEYQFCLKNIEKILNLAKRTYTKVTKKLSPQLVSNSCDFKLLEEKYEEYEVLQEVALTSLADNE